MRPARHHGGAACDIAHLICHKSPTASAGTERSASSMITPPTPTPCPVGDEELVSGEDATKPSMTRVGRLKRLIRGFRRESVSFDLYRLTRPEDREFMILVRVRVVGLDRSRSKLGSSGPGLVWHTGYMACVRRVSMVGLALLALSLLVVSCGAGKDDGSGQTSYQLKLAAHRGELMNGVLTYTRVRRLKVDTHSQFVLRLSGLRAASDAPSPGSGVEQRRARIGGLVGVRMSCIEISCTTISSERQNVLSAADYAEWTWTLSPQNSGTANVSVVVTVYDQDTTNVLAEGAPIRQSILIEPTASYRIKRMTSWVTAVIVLVGASTIGGLVAALWRTFRKHRNSTRSDGVGSRR
jgi:hypothetical protein